MITLEQARQSHPVVFQTAPVPEVSSRYSFVNTGNVVESLMNMGLSIYSIQAPKTKENPEFSKHLVRMNFSPEDSMLALKKYGNVGDSIPQLLINNSHDRTSSLSIGLGMLEKVCANGLIIPANEFISFQKKHMNLDVNALYDILKKAVAEFSKVSEKISAYKSIEMNEKQQRDFASEALELIYNENSARYEIADFLKPRRWEDNVPTLYKTFNRVQENYMKGGTTFSTKKGQKKSKAIKSIEKDVKNNMVLWGLMERYYQNLSK